jgi:hypothetical protein
MAIVIPKSKQASYRRPLSIEALPLRPESSPFLKTTVNFLSRQKTPSDQFDKKLYMEVLTTP